MMYLSCVVCRTVKGDDLPPAEPSASANLPANPSVNSGADAGRRRRATPGQAQPAGTGRRAGKRPAVASAPAPAPALARTSGAAAQRRAGKQPMPAPAPAPGAASASSAAASSSSAAPAAPAPSAAPASSASASVDLAPIERRRRENIAENERQLVMLGLQPSADEMCDHPPSRIHLLPCPRDGSHVVLARPLPQTPSR